MISDYKFYGAKPKARYTALSEACDYASSHRSPSIVLLPPESANINQESDTEDAPEHFTNDDALFEPALELKVDDRSCSSDNDSGSEVEVPTPNRQKTCPPLWKKMETFSKEKPSSVLDKFADLYTELILKTSVDLWKFFVNDDFLELTLKQTLLYARSDENCPKFELCKEEFLQFFGIILISGYHNLPSEQDFWSNSAGLGVVLVSISLSRKPSVLIKSMFHLVDNRELGNNSSKIPMSLQFMIPSTVHLYNMAFSTVFKCG